MALGFDSQFTDQHLEDMQRARKALREGQVYMKMCSNDALSDFLSNGDPELQIVLMGLVELHEEMGTRMVQMFDLLNRIEELTSKAYNLIKEKE